MRVGPYDVARYPVEVVCRDGQLFQASALRDICLRWPFTNTVLRQIN